MVNGRAQASLEAARRQLAERHDALAAKVAELEAELDRIDAALAALEKKP